MRRLNRSSPLTVVALLGALFSPNPAEFAAAVTITKAMLVDKTNGGEVFSGMADADLSVDFVGLATTDCDDTTLTYTWDFGDGNTAVGQNVSHVYGIAGGGNRSPKLTVTDNCGGSDVRENTLSVFVITGIEITQIGDQANPTTNGRLCFDTVRNVEGSALPAGVTGSWRIDWHVQIGTANSNLANSQNGNLPSFVDWPTSNSSWGPNTLFASIDGTSVPGQDGEMILTGTPSIVYDSKNVKVFYEGAGYQNISDDPNWFYYYKDNAGGGAYQYANTAISTSVSGGGIGSIRIGNTAYTGGKYIITDNGNPMGRLRATGWSGINKYYAHFCGVLAHETQHATNQVNGGPADGDGDMDRLTDAFETGTSNTDPGDPISARGFLPPTALDSEVYAGGPVEQAGIAGADTSNDWAHPGTNWP